MFEWFRRRRPVGRTLQLRSAETSATRCASTSPNSLRPGHLPRPGRLSAARILRDAERAHRTTPELAEKESLSRAAGQRSSSTRRSSRSSASAGPIRRSSCCRSASPSTRSAATPTASAAGDDAVSPHHGGHARRLLLALSSSYGETGRRVARILQADDDRQAIVEILGRDDRERRGVALAARAVGGAGWWATRSWWRGPPSRTPAATAPKRRRSSRCSPNSWAPTPGEWMPWAWRPDAFGPSRRRWRRLRSEPVGPQLVGSGCAAPAEGGIAALARACQCGHEDQRRHGGARRSPRSTGTGVPAPRPAHVSTVRRHRMPLRPRAGRGEHRAGRGAAGRSGRARRHRAEDQPEQDLHGRGVRRRSRRDGLLRCRARRRPGSRSGRCRSCPLTSVKVTWVADWSSAAAIDDFTASDDSAVSSSVRGGVGDCRCDLHDASFRPGLLGPPGAMI